MKKLKIELQHCYGIKSLKEQFDFASASACAVYAPNGAMKSSLAKTFQDIADGKASGDRVFPERATSRSVVDETGAAIAPKCILVVRPYDEVFGHTERTSTLLVNAALREEYERLTSLLHCKADTASITEAHLDKIYNGLFGGAGAWKSPGDKVMDTIQAQAAACMKGGSTHKLEGKIVLSLAARFAVESFMVKKINDAAKVTAINALQTTRLLSLYQGCKDCDDKAVRVVKRVVLMTPENIHLNSFMYESILDMSDDHLRALYQDVSKLN